MANVDFAYQFQTTFRWFFDVVPEHAPLFRKRNHGKATHGYVFPSEEIWRDALAIPFIRANGAHDVLFGNERHRSRSQASCQFFRLAAGDGTFEILIL